MKRITVGPTEEYLRYLHFREEVEMHTKRNVEREARRLKGIKEKSFHQILRENMKRTMPAAYGQIPKLTIDQLHAAIKRNPYGPESLYSQMRGVDELFPGISVPVMFSYMSDAMGAMWNAKNYFHHDDRMLLKTGNNTYMLSDTGTKFRVIGKTLVSKVRGYNVDPIDMTQPGI